MLNKLFFSDEIHKQCTHLYPAWRFNKHTTNGAVRGV